MSDLLSMAAPSYEELAARQLRPPALDDHDGIEAGFGRYRLHTRIPAGPGDECFVGLAGGSQFDQFVFVRRIPGGRLAAPLVEALKRRALITHDGIEQIFELSMLDDHSYLVSQLRPPALDDHDGIEAGFGRYRLHTRIPAGPGDECFVGLAGGSQFDQFVFVRRLPEGRLAAALVAALKRRALITHDGIEQIFELSMLDDHSYLVSQLIQGVGLDHLDAALRRRRERLSWTAALAMLHDACERISHLRGAGILHGDLTPARLRLSITGQLHVCHGVPSPVAPAWARVLCDVARPILRLAATDDELALLDRLLRGADADEAALAVASDALVQQHRELDPLLPLLLRSMLEGAPALGDLASMLLDARPQLAIHRMWQLVAEVIATPRPPRPPPIPM